MYRFLNSAQAPDMRFVTERKNSWELNTQLR